MVTRIERSKRIGSSTWKRYIEFLPPHGQSSLPLYTVRPWYGALYSSVGQKAVLK